MDWVIIGSLQAHELCSRTAADGEAVEHSPVVTERSYRGRASTFRPDEASDAQGRNVQERNSHHEGFWGVVGETGGEILVVSDGPDKELLEREIRPEHKGKVIVGGCYVGIEAIRKAIEYEVAGIIAAGIGDKDLKELLGYDLGVAITGHEDLGTTLVVTEGFGQINMAQRTFDLLKDREGMRASICGATQIRAGVIRPEIQEKSSPRVVDPAPDAVGLSKGPLRGSPS